MHLMLTWWLSHWVLLLVVCDMCRWLPRWMSSSRRSWPTWCGRWPAWSTTAPRSWRWVQAPMHMHMCCWLVGSHTHQDGSFAAAVFSWLWPGSTCTLANYSSHLQLQAARFRTDRLLLGAVCAVAAALVQVVGRRALSMLGQFKEQELSNVVWAFAKLHHYDSGLFRQLVQAVANKLPHFLPQVRCCCLLSKPQAQVPAGQPCIAGRLSSHAAAKPFRQSLHCTSSLSVRCHAPHLVRRGVASQGGSPVLTNGSSARQRHNAPPVLIAPHCVPALPQGVSNIAWALATAGHQDEALFEKLLAHCMEDIGSYDVQVRQGRGGAARAHRRGWTTEWLSRPKAAEQRLCFGKAQSL